MRAVVVDAPGGPGVLQVRDVPVPPVSPGKVLVRVRAVGLNRSEVHFRRGQASFGSFPRIPGIEASGVVGSAPGGEVTPGPQVVTMMGGMGRTFDGGHAEYVSVPASQVMPLTSDLPWEVLGAVPEMLPTALGSLSIGVRAQPGDTGLVRGGTSSVGMAVAVLDKLRGMTVLSTTRSARNLPLLEQVGVDHALVDDAGSRGAGARAGARWGRRRREADRVNTLRDTLRDTSSVRPGGTVCFTGMLSDQWTRPTGSTRSPSPTATWKANAVGGKAVVILCT